MQEEIGLASLNLISIIVVMADGLNNLIYPIFRKVTICTLSFLFTLSLICAKISRNYLKGGELSDRS